MGLRMRKFEINIIWNYSFWFTFFVSLGYGTIYKVNNLIIQEGTANIRNFNSSYSPKIKRSWRSFQPILNEGPWMPVMSSKKQIGPCQLEFPSNDEKDFLFYVTEHSTLLWSLMRCHFAPLQIILSWTRFNVLVHSGILVIKSNVSCLDCIDASATEMSTIYQVKYFDSDQWYTVLAGCTSLNLNSLVMINNQSISFFILNRISVFLLEELFLFLFTFLLGGIPKVRLMRRGGEGGPLKSEEKWTGGGGILACVYNRFFYFFKCWDFQNEVL